MRSAAWITALALLLGGCAGAPVVPEKPQPAEKPAEAPAQPLGEATRPRNAEARLAEARQALETRDYRTAIEASRGALSLNPHLQEARALEARALEAAGDLPAALERWEILAREERGGTESGLLLAYASLAERRGRAAEALGLVLARVEERPGDPELRGIAGWLALSLGRGEEARGHLEATWGGPVAERYAQYLARARLLDGDLAGAAAAAEAAAGRPGAGAAEWVLVGDVRRTQGLASSAEEAYRRALALDAGEYAARVNLSVLRLSQGDFAGAEELALAAAELRPEDPEAWTDLGLARRALGKFAAAGEAYERALAAVPGYPPALKNMGILNEKYLGRPAAALPYYDRYLEARPEDGEVAQWRKAAVRRAAEETP